MTFELIEGTHMPLVFTSLRSKTLDALVEGIDERDQADLRELLSDCMNNFGSHCRVILPIAREVGGTVVTWRDFLTIGNLGKFVLHPHIAIMIHHAGRVEQQKAFHIDFNAEFMVFLTTCFIKEYAPTPPPFTKATPKDILAKLRARTVQRVESNQ